MSFQFQYPNHPSTVEFGKIERCVLRHATARAENAEFINSLMDLRKERLVSSKFFS